MKKTAYIFPLLLLFIVLIPISYADINCNFNFENTATPALCNPDEAVYLTVVDDNNGVNIANQTLRFDSTTGVKMAYLNWTNIAGIDYTEGEINITVRARKPKYGYNSFMGTATGAAPLFQISPLASTWTSGSDFVYTVMQDGANGDPNGDLQTRIGTSTTTISSKAELYDDDDPRHSYWSILYINWDTNVTKLRLHNSTIDGNIGDLMGSKNDTTIRGIEPTYIGFGLQGSQNYGSIYVYNFTIDKIEAPPEPQNLVWLNETPQNNTFLSSTLVNITFYLNSSYNATECVLYEQGVVDTVLNPAGGIPAQQKYTFETTLTERSGLTNLWLKCTTESGDVWAQNKSVVVDVNSPTLTIDSPENNTQVSRTAVISWLSRYYDLNLYFASFNISDDTDTVVYYNSSSDIATTNYNISGDLNISDLNTTYLRFTSIVKDGHTAEELAKNWGNFETEKGFQYSIDGHVIDIALQNEVNIISKYTRRETDRYVFGYDFGKNTGQKQLRYIVTASSQIDIVKNTKYKGHIILNNANVWVDFETANPADQVEVKRISSHSVEVTIHTSDDKLTFNSLGELNTASLFHIVNICTPSWNCTAYTCGMNDNATCTEATDLNACGEAYAGDYSEFEPVACNYCSPDISQTYGACIAQSQEVYYTDGNYNSCCLATNLSTDCLINQTPYNISYSQSCKVYKNMTCIYSPNPEIKIAPQPIKWLCEIGDNTEDYNCITYAYDFRGNIVQTNPDKQYIDYIGLIETYDSHNGIVSAEFKPDLVPNTNYTFKIICNSENHSAQYSAVVMPVIEDLSGKAVEGSVYLRENLIFILLLGFVVFIFIILLIGIFIYLRGLTQ